MHNMQQITNINSSISKNILRLIINSKKINYKKLKIVHLKNKIEKLKKDYFLISKNFIELRNAEYKYYTFWELVKTKYNIKKLVLKKRTQNKKTNNVNIIFSDLGKSLGYNPSLLTLLIFDEEIKNLFKLSAFFEELQTIAELENIGTNQRIKIINALKNKKIIIITPLCPDYEHVRLALGLYKYTFNKLNDGFGLIGKRLIKIINNVHRLLKKNDIKFEHYLYYGDFESYSKNICQRLKITESQFLEKLEISSKKMQKKMGNSAQVTLLVKEFSNKKNWLKMCKKNEEKIKKKYKKNINFKIFINEIASSRSALYSSWFPGKNEDDHKDIVIQQGAEYTTMGDLFIEKFKNPIILGLDHPKMGNFYNINKDLPVIYGKPKYV
jgi:hypothetical protein